MGRGSFGVKVLEEPKKFERKTPLSLCCLTAAERYGRRHQWERFHPVGASSETHPSCEESLM